MQGKTTWVHVILRAGTDGAGSGIITGEETVFTGAGTGAQQSLAVQERVTVPQSCLHIGTRLNLRQSKLWAAKQSLWRDWFRNRVNH